MHRHRTRKVGQFVCAFGAGSKCIRWDFRWLCSECQDRTSLGRVLGRLPFSVGVRGCANCGAGRCCSGMCRVGVLSACPSSCKLGLLDSHIANVCLGFLMAEGHSCRCSRCRWRWRRGRCLNTRKGLICSLTVWI